MAGTISTMILCGLCWLWEINFIAMLMIHVLCLDLDADLLSSFFNVEFINVLLELRWEYCYFSYYVEYTHHFVLMYNI